MANPVPKLFNFFRRYVWRAQDFTDFQSFVTDIDRGLAEGAFNGAILKGFDVELSSGMSLTVNAGIGTSPTGKLLCATGAGTALIVAPVANPKKSLIVARPVVTDDTSITLPTSPFSSAFLKEIQGMGIIVIDGAESINPDFPAKGADDIVLVGVRTIVGQVTFADSDLDFRVTDFPTRNSLLGKNAGFWDDRLRPYRNTYKSLGIKPSQQATPYPIAFTFPGKSNPSAFPLTAGAFTNSDTFLDFTTGTISGGDGTSSAFTPTVPTSGNSIVATVVLKPSDDTLKVFYGTQGTYAQCIAAVKNQTYSGAGCLAAHLLPFKVCYVIVTSISGSLSDIKVIDARSFDGGPSEIYHGPQFSLTNGQSSFANITGMVFDKTVHTSVRVICEVNQSTSTGELMTIRTFDVFYRPFSAAWDILIQPDSGDDPGMPLQITSGGQVQYKLGTLSGSGYSGKLKWKAIPFNI